MQAKQCLLVVNKVGHGDPIDRGSCHSMQAQIYKTTKTKTHNLKFDSACAVYQLRCVCFSFHDFINHVASVTLSERGTPLRSHFFAKNVKKPPPWKTKKSLLNDWVLPTFCPLFLLYRRRKWHFDHVFELFFAPAPDPSKIDFLSFWRKILTFVNKSVQTLWASSFDFIDCVTHAVMFLMQRLLCRLMKSI